jgi:aspartokinase
VTDPVITERIRIEGITLSNELVAIIFRNIGNVSDYISRFCRILTKNQINMHFLSTASRGEIHQISCCVALEDQILVTDLINAEFGELPEVEFIASVGLLSLFPHQFSLNILGSILHAIGRERLPLYGLASSLSSLSFITDYLLLNRAVAALQEYLDVPPGRIAFKQEFRVKQSDQVKPT